MADAATVAARLKVEGFGAFQAEMAKAKAGVTGLGDAAMKHPAVFKAAGAAITGFGVAGAAAFGLVVKAAIDFESSFAGVRKTVDATDAQFAELSRGLRDLATVIPINVNELNQVAEAAGQLGIRRDAIIGFTETMAKLGVTTNLSAQEAATSLARFANVMGTNQQDFDRLGSAIVELGNNFATTEAEIVVMAQRLAAAGRIAGLSEGDVLGLATALTSVGINAEAGGTAFTRVMLNMQSAVKEAGVDLEGFANVAGLSAQEFAERFETDAAGAIDAFVQGLGRLERGGTNLVPVLEDLGLNEIRVRNALLSAALAGDKLTTAIETGNRAMIENTALNKEAEERFKTTAAQIQLAKNQLTELAITIGEQLLPTVTSIITAIGGFVTKLSNLNPTLLKVGVIAAAAATALALIVGPALIIIGFLPAIAVGIGLLTAAFAGLSIAMGPITLVILGIGAAIAAGILIWKNWGKIVSWVQAIWEAVSEKIMSVFHSKWSWLLPGGFLITAILFVKDQWGGLWNEIKSSFDSLSSAVSGIFHSKWAWLLPGGALVKMLMWVNDNWGMIWDKVAEVFGKVSDFIAKASKPITAIFGDIAKEAEKIESTRIWDDYVNGLNTTAQATEQVTPKVKELSAAVSDIPVIDSIVTPAAIEGVEQVVEALTGLSLTYENALTANEQFKQSYAEFIESQKPKWEMENRLTDIIPLLEAAGNNTTTFTDGTLGLKDALTQAEQDLANLNKTLAANERAITSNNAWLEQWQFETSAVGKAIGDLRVTNQEALTAIAGMFNMSMQDIITSLNDAGVGIKDLDAVFKVFGIDTTAEIEALIGEVKKFRDELSKPFNIGGSSSAGLFEVLNAAGEVIGTTSTPDVATAAGFNVRAQAPTSASQEMFENRREVIKGLDARINSFRQNIASLNAPEYQGYFAAAIAEQQDQLQALIDRRSRLGQIPLEQFFVNGAPAFAHGVRNFRGGAALVGERGPELVTLPRGANVFSNQQTQGMGGASLVYNQNAPVYGFLDFEEEVAQAWKKTKQAGGFRGVE